MSMGRVRFTASHPRPNSSVCSASSSPWRSRPVSGCSLAVDAAVLLGVLVVARLTPRVVLGRLAAILPFVAFAFLFPFIGDGETISILEISLSIDGLWASWNVLAKATLGGAASIAVTATTPIPELLTGLSRLRVPAAVVAIIGFMFRYLDLMVDEFGRMRRAMAARAHNPQWLWQSRPLASSAGALFVRTYERGERVHDAMAARDSPARCRPSAKAARRGTIGCSRQSRR